MTENGYPNENALAERMNRTLKEEFGLEEIIKDQKTAILFVKNKNPRK